MTMIPSYLAFNVQRCLQTHFLDSPCELVGTTCLLTATCYAFQLCLHLRRLASLDKGTDALKISVAATGEMQVGYNTVVIHVYIYQLTAGAVCLVCIMCHNNNIKNKGAEHVMPAPSYSFLLFLFTLLLPEVSCLYKHSGHRQNPQDAPPSCRWSHVRQRQRPSGRSGCM